MSVDLHDVREAARLVAFSLARTEPGDDDSYRELIAAYLGDGTFRALTDTLADGLTLRPVDCTPKAGLVLAASSASDDGEDSVLLRGSPFAPLADDLRRAGVPVSVRERQLWALGLLAVCYCAFPTSEALEDETQVGQVDPRRAQQVLRDLCEHLDRRVQARVDPPVNEPELERLWRAYLTTAVTGATKDDRALVTGADALIARVCKSLHGLRLLRLVPRVTPDVYRTTPRMQLHVREMAELPYWAELVVAADRLTEDTP